MVAVTSEEYLYCRGCVNFFLLHPHTPNNSVPEQTSPVKNAKYCE